MYLPIVAVSSLASPDTPKIAFARGFKAKISSADMNGYCVGLTAAIFGKLWARICGPRAEEASNGRGGLEAAVCKSGNDAPNCDWLIMLAGGIPAGVVNGNESEAAVDAAGALAFDWLAISRAAEACANDVAEIPEVVAGGTNGFGKLQVT